MKKIWAAMLLMCLLACTPARAEGTALAIDTATVYDGMPDSYAAGYVPQVAGNTVRLVLPLVGSVQGDSIAVRPELPADGPFLLGNYEFALQQANGVFLVDHSFPLRADRVNGAYPVVFHARYTDTQGKTGSQSFTVYVRITDGADPNATPPEATPAPAPIVGRLAIDSATRYDGMEQTYAQGYVPVVRNGVATIILPLVGQTYAGEVTVLADLGAAEGSPFVLGNYSQSARGRGLYVFRLDIPLASGRVNGAYPVKLIASYLDTAGAQAQQEFTVHITITDGTPPPDPNAPAVPEKVHQPELYIAGCDLTPGVVGGEEEFLVRAVLRNIGSRDARNIKVLFGYEGQHILPVDNRAAQLVNSLGSGEEADISFRLQTTKDILAGSHAFTLSLAYSDAYGGAYTATGTFFVQVRQPAAMSYDPIALPKEIAAGETVTLPANVFNIGKSTLRNVMVQLTGAGLFPTSSVFLGDIAPGEAGYGEMKVFIGMLSMSPGHTESYGNTHGTYTIAYEDDAGERYAIEQACSTQIKQPVIAGEKKEDEEDPAGQWWISMLLGLAVIAILVAGIVVHKFSRMLRMK